MDSNVTIKNDLKNIKINNFANKRKEQNKIT